MTRKDFLDNVAGWDNHRFLLWAALQATKGLVVEFGAGQGSTPFIRRFCQDDNREFLSFDNSEKYSKLNGSTFISDWAQLNFDSIDVLFIDHAPGERRWIDIQKYAKIAKIIVIHDSEPSATGYMLNNIWGLFPYRINNTFDNVWATMVSNHFTKEELESYL